MTISRTQGAVDLSMYQPVDSDLTAIAGIAPANDDVIQRKAGVWVNRTIAQLSLDASPAWTAYTPTLVQGGAVPKTVNYAKYIQIGKLVIVNIDLVVVAGAGPVGATEIEIGLPVTGAYGTFLNCGEGWLFDTSSGFFYPGIARMATTTTVRLQPTDGTGSARLGNQNFTAALATGDQIGVSARYEAA